MPTFDEVSVFDAIHAKRDDESILIAIRIPVDGKRRAEWPWFVLESDSDGTPVKDTTTNLVDQTGHQIYRKLFSTEELRTHWDTAEWQRGLYPPLSSSTSPTAGNQSMLSKSGEVEATLEDALESAVQQRQQRKLTPEDIPNQINAAATPIARRSPSYTQRIIAEQVQLGATYYEQVAVQSRQSFDLARLLTVIGAILFVVAMGVMIIPFANGNTTVVGSLGVVTSGVVEAVAGLSFLYNKASAQFARFHIFLDRINRASLSHTMCNELEDQAKKQEMMVNIIQELLKKDE
jgi:hypothetical protein